MKHLLGSAVAGILLGAASVANALVGMCINYSYADGGIYCRDNDEGACVSDLGDFPAEATFEWDVRWGDDQNLYLLESYETHKYIEYKDHLYIDASPGAFAPLRFTVDNSTLAEGETSWAWTAALGLLMWTPTGDPTDGTQKGEGDIVGQGFQLVEVPEYPGLSQAYWNQTKFDEMYAGRELGAFLGICYGDYDPVITQGDRP